METVEDICTTIMRKIAWKFRKRFRASNQNFNLQKSAPVLKRSFSLQCKALWKCRKLYLRKGFLNTSWISSDFWILRLNYRVLQLVSQTWKRFIYIDTCKTLDRNISDFKKYIFVKQICYKFQFREIESESELHPINAIFINVKQLKKTKLSAIINGSGLITLSKDRASYLTWVWSC